MVNASEPILAASLQDLLTQRRSCRAYLGEQVPRRTIEQVLAMAQRTPSWCNSQPWQLVITSGDATDRFRDAYARHAATHAPNPDFPHPLAYTDEYLERRRRCGWQLYASVGVERGDREGTRRQSSFNYRFFGAPHVAIITTPRDLGPYGALDCGSYANNFMLAATALGLGSITQAALASHPDLIRGYFGLPESRLIVAGISFGFADPAHPVNGFQTERAAIADVVTWA